MLDYRIINFYFLVVKITLIVRNDNINKLFLLLIEDSLIELVV